jgi:hypothetical protein
LVTATSSAPPRPPALFFGRGQELERLLTQLQRVRLALVYGVGGVGKTSLLLRVGEQLAAERSTPFVYVQCREGESALTMARAALFELGQATNDLERPIERLVRAGELVLVLDDAHLADATSIAEVARYLVRRSDDITLIVGSRSTLPLSPVDVDHAVVKLGGLEPDATRELWAALEELYGSRPLPTAGDGSLAGGNPLLIKRAFAEMERAGDPLGLAALGPLARELLQELCVLRQPGQLSWLAAGRDFDAVRKALGLLERSFLVEVDRDECFHVHALIREAVYASSFAPGPAAHQRAVAAYQAARDDEQSLIELIHHAARAGADDLLLELLASESAQLRRIPPGSTVLDREIADSIDQLETRRALPPELVLLRARVFGRQGRIQRAWDELMSLPEETPHRDCDLAEVAHMLGNFEVALAAARRVLADEAAPPVEIVLAFARAVDAERALGRIPEMRALLSGGSELDKVGPLAEGVRAWMSAVFSMDAEEYGACVGQIAEARKRLLVLLPESALPMLSSLERTARVHLGAPEPYVDDSGELFDDSASFRCIARLLRAEEYLVRGETRRALEVAEQNFVIGQELGAFGIESFAAWIWAEAALLLGQLDEVSSRVPQMLAGCVKMKHVPPELRLQLILARAHLLAGDGQRASDLAREVAARASDYPRIRSRAARLAGLDVVARLDGYAATESELLDAEEQLATGALDAAEERAKSSALTSGRYGWTELAARAGLVLAECALGHGDPDAASQELERALGSVEARGWALPRIHAAALRAGLARALGEIDLAPDVTVLTSFLSEEDRGRTWAERLFRDACQRLALDVPASVELVSEKRRLRFASEPKRAPDDAVPLRVDAIRGRVAVNGTELDLSKKKSTLSLLVAFVLSGDRWLTPAELAQSAWQLDYHAVRHHSRVAMAVARLRELIGVDWIESGRDGYRFRLPTRWRVLKPV